MIEIVYEPNNGPPKGEIKYAISNKQHSRKSTTNNNVHSSDKEFNKVGMKTSLRKAHKDSSNSSVQLYCAAQIRLPQGYWPRIKVTVIQGKPNEFKYIL